MADSQKIMIHLELKFLDGLIYMGVVFVSKDGAVELRPGNNIKITTRTGVVNGVAEHIYGSIAPFELVFVENPEAPALKQKTFRTLQLRSR